MAPPWRALMPVVALATFVLLGGCGGDDGGSGDGAGSAGSGEVDIEGDTVRFRSDDGDAIFEVDDRGEVRVTDDDGETVLTHGDAAVLPADWPPDLAMPENLELTSASAMTVDGQRRVNITGELAGDPRAIHDDLAERLTAAGYLVQGESFQETDGAVFATVSASGDSGSAAVTLTGSADSMTVSVFLGLAD